eukprot:gnl/Hemi2/5455_TR1873_c0_g1_i1.p2 gnl/Hemi2/5455_TR1873_c0_g1~~gnl/Hemi2/5455_TR1873_c0_g1_i1.p2  ORF type:complete len:107 (-),score=24.48 gnl/Hemi2/5455_TR1873_c0_g1_i1:145-465(-)
MVFVLHRAVRGLWGRTVGSVLAGAGRRGRAAVVRTLGVDVFLPPHKGLFHFNCRFALGLASMVSGASLVHHYYRPDLTLPTPDASLLHAAHPRQGSQRDHGATASG